MTRGNRPMARPSNKQRRMAELYVNGPAFVAGKWQESAIAAGLDPTPSQDDPTLAMLITKLGGTPPGQSSPEEGEAPDFIAELLVAKEQGIPWSALRDKLSDVVESVAKGTTRATAAQVSMLKYILEEAKSQGDTDKTVNVVLLPVQGAGATLRFEELARLQVAEHQAKDDTKT